jgi:large subunit ribosomal protein L4
MALKKVAKTEETKKKRTSTKAAATKAAAKEAYATLSIKELGIENERPEVSEAGFSNWVRTLMQNWRQGTVGCKDRSEVNFSNKKPWKQKGTGRARAGSARSPLWRKGGVVFGPQARTKVLRVSKKLRQNVLGAIAFNQLDAGRVACLDWSLQGDKPQTAAAFKTLHNAQLTNDKLAVFIPMDDMLTYASFVNIPNVRVLFYDQANAYDLTHSDRWVVFKKDVNLFKEMVGRWI